MKDDELRELVTHLSEELDAREHDKARRVVKVRRYVRHEAVRVAHEIGLAAAGVLVADHYVVPLLVHTVPALMG